MTSFVLQHGAGHGAWCWYKIKARLERLGHKVYAPDMPGHGIDLAPRDEVTLDQIVERLGEAIATAAEPVVLVGHSYGGAAITQAGENFPDKIRKLVYLTAVLLPNGTSASQVHDDERKHRPKSQALADGKLVSLQSSEVRQVFYNLCGDDDVALAQLLMVPEAIAGYMTPVRTTDARFGQIPRVYIECTQDRALSISAQRQLHATLPCQQVFTLDADHSPFFSMPDELTAILDPL